MFKVSRSVDLMHYSCEKIFELLEYSDPQMTVMTQMTQQSLSISVAAMSRRSRSSSYSIERVLMSSDIGRLRACFFQRSKERYLSFR